MTYSHPTIRIEQPAPGHYVITGHNPASVLVPDTGHVVPPAQCYIPPEVPTELLLAIIADRGDRGDTAPKRAVKGGRK